jgi:hypothetical protein
VRRSAHHIREGLEEFWKDDKVLPAAEVGRLARMNLEVAFSMIINGKEPAEVLDKTVERFSVLLGTYVAGEKKVFWQEFKRLFDAGVIKKAAFIDYLIKDRGFDRLAAVEYVAKTFGMNESTQSVYSSDEYLIRQKEKESSQIKKALKAKKKKK